MMRISAYARSDVGLVRQSNEDGVYAGATAFAVADGMGGHAAGEVASATALQPLAELDGVRFDGDDELQHALLEAIEVANRSVVAKATEEPTYQGMGTTLTAAVVQDGTLHLAHVGDSRAYLLRGRQPLIQLTTDHTVVEELVRDGRLTREQIDDHPQRAVITRAIGIDEHVEADSYPGLALQPGDQVLLCSDGLTGPVSDEEIAEILRAHDDGGAASQALIDAAKAAGAPDNVTVLLIRVTSDAGPATADAPASGAGGAVPDATQELTFGPPDVAAGPPSSGYVPRQWAASTVPPTPGPGSPTHGGQSSPPWRLIGMVVALFVVVALVAAGAWVVAARAWFVGEHNGSVTIFHGVNSELAGVKLHRVAERTDLAVEDLAPRWQQRLADGIRRTSAAEAERLVQRLRQEAQRARQDALEAPWPERDSERDTRSPDPGTVDPGAGSDAATGGVR